MSGLHALQASASLHRPLHHADRRHTQSCSSCKLISRPDHLQADSSMRPGAAKAYALIREALEADPLLPLALHLDIHLSEAGSPLRSAAFDLWRSTHCRAWCCMTQISRPD